MRGSYHFKIMDAKPLCRHFVVLRRNGMAQNLLQKLQKLTKVKIWQ